MAYDILVRFPSKEIADEWIGQMSDGWGEGHCDFSVWYQIPGSSGHKQKDYKKVTSSAPEGTPVFFVNSIEQF